uniref:Uncharacterized protein n=1 Tax=Anguilla anguilla TaxID=7936 RepID=A0A0E9S226_ANGAN
MTLSLKPNQFIPTRGATM